MADVACHTSIWMFKYKFIRRKHAINNPFNLDVQMKSLTNWQDFLSDL